MIILMDIAHPVHSLRGVAQRLDPCLGNARCKGTSNIDWHLLVDDGAQLVGRLLGGVDLALLAGDARQRCLVRLGRPVERGALVLQVQRRQTLLQ